jgi:D-3-phosphoglycerate dehydrogenase
MINKSRGDVAYNLIDVADEPAQSLIDSICAIDSVMNVREFRMA